MENYAVKLLEKSGDLHRGILRVKQDIRSVPCAFCKGSGCDPHVSNECPVCRGRKKVTVRPPVVSCLICRGVGQTSSGLECLACRGIGFVSVARNADICMVCNGTGYQGEGVFYCSVCKGQGIY